MVNVDVYIEGRALIRQNLYLLPNKIIFLNSYVVFENIAVWELEGLKT